MIKIATITKKITNASTIKSLKMFVEKLNDLEEAVRSFKNVHQHLVDGYKKDKDFDWMENYPSLLNSQVRLETALQESRMNNIILKVAKNLKKGVKVKKQRKITLKI